MDTDTSNEKFSDSLDLRQVSVNFIKSLKLLLDELLYQSLCITICKVSSRIKLLRILNRARALENEHNTW